MKTVIEMAREAGLLPLLDEDCFQSMGTKNFEATKRVLERFAELVRADERNSWPAEMEAMERQVNILTDALAEARADEREQLAQLADKVVEGKLWFNDLPAAIRARSNHD